MPRSKANDRLASTYETIAAHPKSTVVELEKVLGRPVAGEVDLLARKGLVVGQVNAKKNAGVDLVWQTTARAKRGV